MERESLVLRHAELLRSIDEEVSKRIKANEGAFLEKVAALKAQRKALEEEIEAAERDLSGDKGPSLEATKARKAELDEERARAEADGQWLAEELEATKALELQSLARLAEVEREAEKARRQIAAALTPTPAKSVARTPLETNEREEGGRAVEEGKTEEGAPPAAAPAVDPVEARKAERAALLARLLALLRAVSPSPAIAAAAERIVKAAAQGPVSVEDTATLFPGAPQSIINSTIQDLVASGVLTQKKGQIFLKECK